MLYINGLCVVILAIFLWKGYHLLKRSVEDFTRSVAQPCDEAARTIRDARQCGHAVAGETKKFLEKKENRDNLKQAAAAILILGIASGISGALNPPPERQTHKPVQMRTSSLRERRKR